ncbi:MAG: alpha/beta hydrolase [Gaiellaceae bacterium]
MTAEPVEIECGDGVVIRGELSGKAERWAILLHDVGDDLDSWGVMRGELISAGMRVLALDLRGHGASDGEWSPEACIADIEAAIRYCRASEPRSVYLVGAGQGATASIVAAGAEPVHAVVCLSPALELEGVDPARLRVSRAPKFITVGSSDEQAMSAAQQLYRKTLGWRMLESRALTEQGTGLLSAPGSELVLEKTVAFLGDY